jgi:hypothetical protein
MPLIHAGLYALGQLIWPDSNEATILKLVAAIGASSASSRSCTSLFGLCGSVHRGEYAQSAADKVAAVRCRRMLHDPTSRLSLGSSRRLLRAGLLSPLLVDLRVGPCRLRSKCKSGPRRHP